MSEDQGFLFGEPDDREVEEVEDLLADRPAAEAHAEPATDENGNQPVLADDPSQQPLFDRGEWWEEHWRGMPEFVQDDLSPYKTVYVHFESREDMDAFSALVGQRLTMDTRSIYYPEATIGRLANKRYVDGEPAGTSPGDD